MGTSSYTEEFRQAAVKMVLEKGMTPKQVAAELGTTDKSVRDWLKKHSNGQRAEYLRIQELEQEVRHLKKELSKSQEIVEILKKTALILGEH
ncbi:MAG: transposase [Peptococcaceae bacterium]|jgi:transposase|nr:transposase [Peptococcaceae bacterium]